MLVSTRGCTEVKMPSECGTYALILSCSTNRMLPVGQLGDLQLQPGCYVYVGSAFGPGGLRARVGHHKVVSRRPHWHIDYLRLHTQLDRVWYSCAAVPLEHAWADLFKHSSDAWIPIVGFGASDCDCESHLFFFDRLSSAAWKAGC